MKKCPNCAKEIQDDVSVCPVCNHQLAAAPAPVPPAPEEARTSGKAVASLLLSFFSFLLFPGILAVVLGHISRSEIRKSSGRLKGAGVALAGLILGYAGIVFLPFLLIIAAIAIPNLLRARLAANEASAVGCLRTINTAVVVYKSSYRRGFPVSLLAMGPATTGKTPSADAADLIDETLVSGIRSGYRFSYAVTQLDENGLPTAYEVHADPVVPGNTGFKHFYTDQTGVIRIDRAGPANQNSPPVE